MPFQNLSGKLLPVLVLTLITACSFKAVPTPNPKLQIILQPQPTPMLLATTVQSYYSVTSTPSTVSDFSCFSANITGPGVPSQNPYGCNSSDNMNGRGFGLFTEPAARGRTIEVDLPSGRDRTVSIYGIYPPVSQCGSSAANGSGGYFLGSKTLDIFETSSVSVPISYGGQPYSLSCSGGPSGPGGTNTQEFGTGTAGDLTVNATIADVKLNNALQGGRTFSYYDRVINVDATGTVFTLNSIPVAADIATGDEILWVVMGERVAGDCSTAANELYPGKWGTASVTSVNLGAKTVTLATPIVTTPAQIVAANLNTVFTTPNSCFIQMVRIPNFNNLTLNSAGTINISPSPFDYANGGGVLALRIKGSLTFAGGGSHVLTTSGKGFPGGSVADQQGGSHIKAAGTVAITANGSGGGGGNGAPTRGGGGGANRGAGGDGNNNAGSAGAAVNCNAGGSTDCAFAGGGGGSSNTAGGIGGGLIFVWAKSVVGSGAITANGAQGGDMAATRSGGGGAGGWVLFRTQASAATTVLQALGGAGGDGTTQPCGGGGGGGQVNAFYCSGAAPTASVLGGTVIANPAPGIAGTDGLSVLTLNATHGSCYE